MKLLFVKALALFSLILCLAFVASAQDAQCSALGGVRLFGLRLGMTPPEVSGVFGGNPKIKIKSSGERVFFQNYIGKRPPRTLQSVRALYLRFLDGALYQIEIFYDESASAPTLEELTNKLSAQMQIPSSEVWQIKNDRAVIECGAVRIVADQPVDARVSLTDTAREAEAATHRKKEN